MVMTAAQHAIVWNNVAERLKRTAAAAKAAHLTDGAENALLQLAVFAGTIACAYQDCAAFPLASTWAGPHEPNARLIASAPDLLKAAEMLDSIEMRMDHGDADVSDWPIAMTALRAAIAKATGAQP